MADKAVLKYQPQDRKLLVVLQDLVRSFNAMRQEMEDHINAPSPVIPTVPEDILTGDYDSEYRVLVISKS